MRSAGQQHSDRQWSRCPTPTWRRASPRRSIEEDERR